MLSITEIKRRLRDDFIEELYQNYSPLTVDKILIGMSEKRATTLRVNTIKYSVQELMQYFKEINIKFERVPWYKDALLLKNINEKEIQKLDIYEKGYVYLQSLSSMVPPLVLEPKEGEKILDLTAAPGSKTTQIASLMQNNGYVLANELDKIRCERLKYNIENQGCKIIEVMNANGEIVGNQYEEYFDKVLLDAPCSGEGRFIATDPQTYRKWSKKQVNELAKLQKKLLKSAYKALKPNGTMVYSTCTMNKEENEYLLDWACNNFEIEILDIDLQLREAIPAFTEEVNKSIQKAIRILPSKQMEGFFVAKIKKIK